MSRRLVTARVAGVVAAVLSVWLLYRIIRRFVVNGGFVGAISQDLSTVILIISALAGVAVGVLVWFPRTTVATRVVALVSVVAAAVGPTILIFLGGLPFGDKFKFLLGWWTGFFPGAAAAAPGFLLDSFSQFFLRGILLIVVVVCVRPRGAQSSEPVSASPVLAVPQGTSTADLAAPALQASTQPPGWYPDPSDPSRNIYWNGSGWSQPSRLPAVPQTSILAIMSLVTAFVVPLIVPIIFGHLARREIRESRGIKTGDGMAIAGLVLGYIFLAFFVIYLIAIGVAVSNS